MKKFYVTTPLYYVNAKPHLGTLYSTLLADVAARWHRFSGDEVFFLTGTDEHGQKIADQAASHQMQPKAFVDSMIPAFKEAWERYAISYDFFIRTTDAAHKQAVTRWIEQLQAQGDIYKAVYEGLYCTPCETFVTAEQAIEVEGQSCCPSCHRGLAKIAEENYFFRLSAYQDRLLTFYQENPDFIMPKERTNEILSFVRGGLRDLSISRRSVEWGIPFPGDPNHTVYVWGDALMNYVSALGFLQRGSKHSDKFSTFWPADLQVMAKDIVKFHAVYFPAFLMAAGVKPAKQLLVHGYLLVAGDKMSKSKGNACDPLMMADTYGVDQVRYYLVRHMPTTHDGNFALADMAQRIGSDLANSLGNLLQRSASLALKHRASVVQPVVWGERSLALRSECAELLQTFGTLMDDNQFAQGYAELWKFVNSVNRYFHDQEPWKIATTHPEQFAEVMATTCQALFVIGHLMGPVMPFKSKQLLAALGHTLETSRAQLEASLWQISCTLFVPQVPLFVRPEIPEAEPALQTSGSSVVNNASPAAPATETPDNLITIADLAKVELVVGQIVACQPIAKSDKLYQMQVTLGKYGERQILAGVATYFTCEELIGKRGLFVTNLAPRTMLGTMSQGMMLVAKDGDVMMLVSVPEPIPLGTRLG